MICIYICMHGDIMGDTSNNMIWDCVPCQLNPLCCSKCAGPKNCETSLGSEIQIQATPLVGGTFGIGETSIPEVSSNSEFR